MPETLLTPPPPPVAKEEDDLDLKIQLADVSQGVTSNAVDAAEEYINGRTNERGVRTILRKIWHGNIARDYYRQRQIRRGRQEIIETGNIYALDEGSQAEHDQAMAAVVERFISDHLHNGEANRDLETVSHGQELMDQIRALVSEYARGVIDYDALIEERTRIISEFGQQAHDQDRNRGLMYADNILEVAANARTAFEHGLALERIDAALSAQIGEARVGVRTEQRREATDRALDWLHSHHITMANEATLGAAVGIAIGLAKWTTKKVATTTTAALSLGVGAGLIAGLREHHRVGQERQLHLRQRAEGQQMPGSQARRREQFENTRYETVSAEQLSSEIQNALDGLDLDNPATLQALLGNISHARARISMSDEQGMDLIEYSSKTSVEQERLDLDILLAQATETLQQALNKTDPGADVDQLVSANLDVINDYLQSDIQQKDRAFRSLRIRRVLKMAAIAFVAGETIGLAAQELHSLADSGLRGVFEDDGGDRRSLLAGWLHSDGKAPDGSGLNREYFEGPEFLQDQTHKVGLDLPEGYHLVNVRPGEQFGWDIIGPDGKPVLDKGLEWDTQGNLAKWVRQELTEGGWNLHQNPLTYNDSDTITQSITRDPSDYIEKHPNEFIRIHRELWYDNNTPAPNFDLNELRQYWGGVNGSGIDESGNYVFNIANMRPDWSFHGAETANAPQLIQEGKMYVALSMSRDTQQWVEMIPVDKNGNAIIYADSFAGKNMFNVVNNHAHFRGAFAEAVQVTGHTPDGGVSARMMATVVGENKVDSVTDTVQRTVIEKHTHFITALEPPTDAPPIEVPPVLPIYSRRGLEALTRPEGAGYGYYAGGGETYVNGRSADRPRRGIAPFAPEIENNPDAAIDANKTTARYLRSLRPSYKKTLNSLKSQLDKEKGAEKPKLVVMIPAAAHQEGKNIYRTLQQYALQQGVASHDFEIVVFANHPVGSKPDRTMKEIRRFQKDYPDMNVRLIRKQLEPKEANIGWVRKAATDTVITDLMDRGIDLNEVLLVSNDADSQWIDPNYLKTVVEKASAQPEVDGFLGFIDWGYDAYKAHPETLASTRLMQMIEIFLRKKRGEIGSSGANFVFRPGAYTAVGGYRSNTPLGEDVELGSMIKGMRSGANTRRPIAFLGRSSEINTSARRALEKLFKDGGAPAAQWDEFGINDELRTKEFNLVDFDFNDRLAVDRLVESTERMLNQTLNLYRNSLATEVHKSYQYGRLNLMNSETMRNLNRMFTVIGIKVRWMADGTFAITDAARMIDNLRRWQTAH